jgi:hypothetical protein
MANARQKKKVSGRVGQGATRKVRGQKARRRRRTMAARARTDARVFRTVQPAGEPARDVAERQNGSLARAFGIGQERQHATEHAGNPEGVVQSTTVDASPSRSLLQELFNFPQQRMEQNLTRLFALTFCRTPPQALAAQSELIRDNLAAFVRIAQRIAEASMQMTHETMRRMSGASLAPR